MLENAHAPPHVLRRACHLLLLACRVNHQGLYHTACHSPHALILPSPLYVRIRTVSNIHQHSSGLCDVGATLITTLYSHDMLLHVLKPRGALGKPISPSFAETYLALGTPTEVASNYGQAYSQEQNNDCYNHIVPASDASVILGHMSWFMHERAITNIMIFPDPEVMHLGFGVCRRTHDPAT